MVVLLVICTIILVICAVKWISRDKELYNFADNIAGPKAYAVIGSAHKILKKSEHGKIKSQVVKFLNKAESSQTDLKSFVEYLRSIKKIVSSNFGWGRFSSFS